MSFKQYFNVYNFSCELPGSGKTVNFKPLTTKEIKKLLVYENITEHHQVENVLDQMIQSSVIDEEFDLNELYLQDRFFLLTEIRKKTKGEEIEEEFECPKCKSQNYIIHDLNKLPVKKLDNNVDNRVELMENVFINLWYITRGQEKEAFEKTDNSLSKTEKDADIQLNILTQGIKSVETPEGKEENLSFEDKKYIVDSLTIKNINTISKWYQDNTFGVDFSLEKKCRNCEYKEVSEIPLVNFFTL